MAPVVRALRAAPERFESHRLRHRAAPHHARPGARGVRPQGRRRSRPDGPRPDARPASPPGILDRLPPLLRRVRPDVILVQGDTTTTFAAAFAAFLERIPAGHVEAGLRTGDRWQPFPEEMNRVLTTRIAALHFAPTPAARDALLAEGMPAGGRATSPATRSSTRCCRRCGPTTGSARPALAALDPAPPGGAGDDPPARELRRAAPVHLRRHPGARRPLPRAPVRAAGAPEPGGQAARSRSCSATSRACT